MKHRPHLVIFPILAHSSPSFFSTFNAIVLLSYVQEKALPSLTYRKEIEKGGVEITIGSSVRDSNGGWCGPWLMIDMD